LVETSGWLVGYVERLFPGQSLDVWGDLSFVQKKPLPSYGLVTTKGNATNVTRLDEGVFNEADFHLANFFPMEMQRRNFESNFSVDLLGKTENWLPVFNTEDNSTQQSQRFTAHFRVLIREQNLTYRTDALELLKWAWIQYFAILIIVRHIFGRLSAFLYQNHILGTIVNYEWKIKSS